MYRVVVNGEVKEYREGIRYFDIAREYQKNYEEDIVLVKSDGKLKELHMELTGDCEITFITTKSNLGIETYKRSTVFLLIKSIYDVAGHDNVENVRVRFPISNGIYIETEGNFVIDDILLSRIKKRMLELVKADKPIKKRMVSTDDAIEIFAKHNMHDKERLFRYRRVSSVNIYSINEFEDYFYGYMVYSTGYLKYFELYRYDNGLVLQLPEAKSPGLVPEFKPGRKVFEALRESSEWSNSIDVHTVGALNDKIAEGRLNEIILVHEALMEKKIADIALRIAKEGNKKLVLIAGPSSSGKTTFSRRLSIQLKAYGLNPHPISVDNYFVDRDKTPRDEYGDYDFEALESIDTEKFNNDMIKLLSGEQVELPIYNFKQGKSEYRGNFLQIGSNDILVIEGIHCLNDRLTYRLPRESRFKIYISALSQLNIDEHNRIPAADGRLIRRIVRDSRTRGTDAKSTIAMWPSVRRGEDINIFPYQESADVVFNSGLVYELPVLKSFAEPLLFGIPKACAEYDEAKRLLKFFDYFLSVDTENIPKNSLLREFIGGSCFEL